MKSLVLAEKPSVARDIARVLKCGKKINGALEGDHYAVSYTHLDVYKRQDERGAGRNGSGTGALS